MFPILFLKKKMNCLAADALILPGVGAFRDAMERLNEIGLTEMVSDYVASGKPLLGICLGMQLLFEESEENGLTTGMGILPGRVVRFTGHPKTDNPIRSLIWAGINLAYFTSITGINKILMRISSISSIRIMWLPMRKL